MKQRTLAMVTGFERYAKKTPQAQFLEEMNQVGPWRELCALVEPMLRIYFLQQWFNLSDPARADKLCWKWNS